MGIIRKEWIGGTFATNGSGGTVSGINHCGIGERKKILTYGFDQLRPISSRKIRSPYGTLEKRVSRNYEIVLLIIECDAAWRMSRNVQDFKFSVTYLYYVAFLQVCVYGYVFYFLHNSESIRLHLQPFAQKFIILVSEHRHPESFFCKRDSYGMVNVQMRVDYVGNGEVIALYEIHNRIFFFRVYHTRVYYHALSLFRIINRICVYAEQAEFKFRYFQHTV